MIDQRARSDPDPPVPPCSERLVRVLGLAVLALWLFSGLVWWVPVIAVVLALLVRALRVLLPSSLRRWMPSVVLALVLLVELAATTVWQWLVVAGAVALVPGLRRWRVSRWPAIIAVVVMLVGASGWGWTWWAERQRQAAAAAADHEFAKARMLPDSPNGVVFTLLTLIAREDRQTCSLFSEAGAQQFATAHGAPDCTGAVRRLREQVRDPARYPNPTPATIESTTSARSLISTCSMSWSTFVREIPDPGPRLAVLLAERQHGLGYLIVGYRPC
ncbi:hypothetical protein ABT324_28260 [Saccharopolyspora sp. NPDC000359]|uniref:hypothetical protein n=1 Tax=Saccharopolyspora sp. NPDC000359 TaxID=3154251 RepID=UPI003330BA71